MTDQSPPQPEIEDRSHSMLRNLSVVWLVPVLALVVALGIAWQAYSDRGSLIEIRFENGAGVQAGETTLRYRDVVIGEVEDVHFSADLQHVVVAARVDTEILPFLDEGASFWVVRPEISAQGVSGLSTVVSGVYIEGAWDSEPGDTAYSFVGLERPLFVRPGELGRRITLNVPSNSQLAGGEPLIYRGLEVGRLEAPQLVGDTSSVLVNAFVEAPFDQYISTATRFWDSSGFSIDFDSSGLSLDVESLASLVGGGIQFDEVFSNGAEVPNELRFDIYDSEEAARASAFLPAIIGTVPVTIQFTNFTRGLQVGLSVLMEGERVGQVTSVVVHSFDTPTGPERRHVASILLDAAALGLPSDAAPDEVYEYLEGAVDEGLRARLTSTGLITSEFSIELAEVPSPDDSRFDRTSVPFPRIPAIATPRTTVNATAEGVLERVAALPFERLLTQAIDTLASIETLAGNNGLQEVQDEALSLIADARVLIGSEETQAIPGTAAAAMNDLRAVLRQLRENGSVATLDSVLTRANTAMRGITQSSNRLPGIMENLTVLTETIAALELEALTASASSVLARADTFLSSEDLANVPPALAAAMEDLETLLSDLTEADVAGSLTTTLANADSVFEQADVAMGSITEASTHLPGMMENLATLSETAAALEIDALVTSASTVLAAADTFLSDEDLAAVPPALSSALTELETMLADLTAADVVGSLNTTLASTEAAASELPGLVTQTEAVLAQIGTLSSAYGTRSAFLTEAMDVLREITTAARSIAQLARTIERNPNSLLTGR